MPEIKKCNTCGNTFPSNLSFCLNDGNPLVQVDTLVGSLLDGRYRLNSLIGVGGMGDVYRATHVHLDTEFAVKLLKPEFVSNQTAIKRFRLEAKAAGRIHHPNAVRVTDFGVSPEGIVYLVMELVQGQSLRNIISSEGKLGYIRSVNIVRQVCGALDAAHRSGVIHRDLKPDNILIESVNDVERVKVLDFGIAKLRETTTDAFLTQAGTIIGTPQYMSPEQCQGKHLDPRSDIYSIGILLYEMLTGVVPFDGESMLQVVYNQLHQLPRPVLELSPNVPAELADVIMRTLEKDPEQRQSSAIQLSNDLKQALEWSGEEGSFSIADPMIVRPIKSADSRTAEREDPTAGDLANASSWHSGERQGALDRSTIPLSRRGLDPDLSTDKVKVGRTTSPEQDVPTGRKVLDSDQATAESAPGGKSKIVLIAAAGIILAVLALVAAYFGLKDEQPIVKVTQPQPPKAPPEMVLIPGGKFMMGRSDGAPDEGPVHEVEIKPFFLDIQEVTNQDYKKFVDATGHAAPKNWKFNGTYGPGEALLPVTYVTWDDATAYAKWAGKRLPTEAEWEYAARGGDKGYLYPWGNQWVPGYANVDRKSQTKPAPVRSTDKDVSSFGVYDLAGNVSEWVQDNYSERYGSPVDQRLRVYRGGNFLDAPGQSTATYRWADFPTNTPDDQIVRVGFRCAKDVE